MLINVKAKPRSAKNELIQLDATHFEIKVTAPPERGKANDAVIKILSGHFKTAKSNIIIKAGKTAREKVFEINKKT